MTWNTTILLFWVFLSGFLADGLGIQELHRSSIKYCFSFIDFTFSMALTQGFGVDIITNCTHAHTSRCDTKSSVGQSRRSIGSTRIPCVAVGWG